MLTDRSKTQMSIHNSRQNQMAVFKDKHLGVKLYRKARKSLQKMESWLRLSGGRSCDWEGGTGRASFGLGMLYFLK